MFKKPKLSQNNLKIGLFVDQSENQYFWGHSSFVLQLPAHFFYSLTVSSAAGEEDASCTFRCEEHDFEKKYLYQNLWFGT